jgi:hypothetical protein
MFGSSKMAAEAIARIDSHEKVCTERWSEARKAWTETAEAVKEVRDSLTTSKDVAAVRHDTNSKFWLSIIFSALGALILALITALGIVLWSDINRPTITTTTTTDTYHESAPPMRHVKP